MDEAGFREYLKKLKKPKRTIESYVKRVMVFESFLKESKLRRGLDDATREDVEEFAMVWGRQMSLNIYQYLWGIMFYYYFSGETLMRNYCDEMKEWVQLEKTKLRDFPGFEERYIKNLSKLGIKTVRDLLEIGKTEEERIALEELSGVPRDSIFKLVKLSNLARIGGLKKKRANLFYDAGFDTLDKIAVIEPGELIDSIAAYIEREGFDGRGLSRSEAENTVTMARFLRRIIK